jgi:uncharacterized membrane protein SpoIIM required for sporulation
MKVVDLLEKRRSQWRELEGYCARFNDAIVGRQQPADLVRFAALYRAACADLALADAYQLPPNTIQYLHQLVARAHNQLYRSSKFQPKLWLHELFVTLPQQFFNDGYLRVAFGVFWGVFIACMITGFLSIDFCEAIMGKEQMSGLEEMYEKPITGRDLATDQAMSGFYVWHNAGIGLQCFALGMFFGVGGLLVTLQNAAILGTAFGYMATTAQRGNFFHFVTAHGPFELTAIVLSAAAGMRLGFALVNTQGKTRGASLREAGRQAVPAACLAVLLFCLAAVIEAFISPSALPYTVKALVAILSASILTFYFVVLGYPRGDD